MLIQEREAIFVHVPKGAGQSIDAALLDDIGLDWGIVTGAQSYSNVDCATFGYDRERLAR